WSLPWRERVLRLSQSCCSPPQQVNTNMHTRARRAVPTSLCLALQATDFIQCFYQHTLSNYLRHSCMRPFTSALQLLAATVDEVKGCVTFGVRSICPRALMSISRADADPSDARRS